MKFPAAVTPDPDAAPRRGKTSPAEPILMPCLMLGRGRVMLPGEDGPVIARDDEGKPLDPLDVTDRLNAKYSRLYVVDLDGIESDRPQLDYLQEISRDGEVWIDAGVKTGDQAIDVLVAGARRAVLSTAHLESPRELSRAWKLSPDLVLEVETEPGGVRCASSAWEVRDARSIAQSARALGISEVVLSPRGGPVDWPLVRAMSQDGSLWVNGSFEHSDAPKLAENGASGGIFHINGELAGAPPKTSSTSRSSDDG
ncbi:MAG: HisA/HisF-related TIM barrel protein [Candidatus Lutacidiplasmatales archaeon]